MKLSKYILMTSALLLGATAYADDFDSFDDFGSFGDDGAESAASKLEVNGSVDTEIRAYLDTSDVEDKDGADKIEMDVTPSASLDLTYSGNKSDLSLTFKVGEDTIKNHPEDVIDEAVLRGYFGNLTLEAGKMKVVWGKGDKLHVLDNFNADDYSDFIIPDYLDRRVSTPMVRGIISLPVANLNIEGVYTPLLPTDRFATEGRWTPAQVNKLTGLVTDSAKDKVADAFTKYTTDTATAGTLSALNTDYLAAQKAYSKAYEDMYAGALAAGITETATSKAIIAAGGESSWNGLSDEQKNAYIQNVLGTYGTAIEAGVKAALTEDKIKELLRTKGYGYYLDNLTVSKAKYEAACEETGYDADSIKDELKSAGEAYMLALTYANGLSADPTVIYPDLWTLKYGQFGGRATWTLGQVDMGISYYNGWYKQPSFNASKLDTFLAAYLANGEVAEEDKFLAYDKKQTFGLEASSVIWHFNVRGEFAYNLTEDTDGTDPWVHNNSIAWLGGFDIDLPFWNANINVQETGTFILNGDECDKLAADVDYNEKGYTNNKLVCNITTSFLNDKLAPEVTVMYGIERGDLVVMPKLAFKPDQNLTLTASGMIINCADEDSEFYSWRKNSFASLTACYQF